jgi:hypothetical protein
VAHGIRIERNRRLHADKRQQFHHVVLDHVAHCSRLFVKRPATLNANALRSRDLHMIDVVAVPYRLKDAVRKAKHQNVLDGLLAQIVIDPEDLAFVENFIYFIIQLARAIKIMSKRLLYNYSDRAALGMRHPVFPQAMDDVGEVFRGNSKVEEPVSFGPALLIVFFQ